MCCFFVEVYVKFDGLMHPQLKSKEGSKSILSSVTGIFYKIKKFVIPSSEDETKYSPALALRIYLSKYHKILTGKVCSNNGLIKIITDIIYIFNSLYKTYLQIDNNSRSLPNSSDIRKVFISLFVIDC